MTTETSKPGTAMHRMSSALVGGYVPRAKFHNWLIAINGVKKPLSDEEKAEKRKHPPDAIEVVAYWAEAKDMEHVIDTMPPEQKAQELEVTIKNSPVFGTLKDYKDKSFDDLVSDEINMNAWIDVTDEDAKDGPVFSEVLNRQLKEALDEWQNLIEDGYHESYEMYSDAREYCDRRDILEYAAAGIEIIRIDNHLQDLPYFDEYVRRLKELDIPFRKLLDGQTVPKPYADKTFWWRQK